MRMWEARKEKWQNFLDSQVYWKYVKKTFFPNSYPHSELFASATQQIGFACTPDPGCGVTALQRSGILKKMR